jgi:hypothetical protein
VSTTRAHTGRRPRSVVADDQIDQPTHMRHRVMYKGWLELRRQVELLQRSHRTWAGGASSPGMEGDDERNDPVCVRPQV